VGRGAGAGAAARWGWPGAPTRRPHSGSAAATQPPHLRAIAPVVIGSNFFDGWVYQGGAFQLGFNLFWVQVMAGRGKRTRWRSSTRTCRWRRRRWSQKAPGGRFYREWLEHTVLDDYWHSVSIDSSYADVRVPALNVGGWYDLFLGGTLENFVRMRREAGASARARTRACSSARGRTAAPTAPIPITPSRLSRRAEDIDLQGLQLRVPRRDELFDREPASPPDARCGSS
jgi:hypothetical protein